jgi:4a-hydroxytetrahydrobiopterin dehydratase
MDLQTKKCVPCEGGTPPLTPEEIQNYHNQIDAAWHVVEDKKIQREYTFKDFKEAMKFVNAVAEIAESEGHHPDIHISYNHVRIVLWTHAVGGLTENDFILASKVDVS